MNENQTLYFESVLSLSSHYSLDSISDPLSLLSLPKQVAYLKRQFFCNVLLFMKLPLFIIYLMRGAGTSSQSALGRDNQDKILRSHLTVEAPYWRCLYWLEYLVVFLCNFPPTRKAMKVQPYSYRALVGAESLAGYSFNPPHSMIYSWLWLFL